MPSKQPQPKAGKVRPPKTAPDLTNIEKALFDEGFSFIAGVDEAGRGSLAGPVVAASVILPRMCVISGLKDSKQLTPKQRERFFEIIKERACAWSYALVDAGEVDRINVLRASLEAMRSSVLQLTTVPDYVLIDGPHGIKIDIPQKTIINGDALSQSIAAASVVAKVTRDRLMCEYRQTYPMFSFDVHKGYGTEVHLSEIREHGPTPIHRRTFRGVSF